MKSDLDVDCPLAFSILLDEELGAYEVQSDILKCKLHDLLMMVFKEGLRCGQRPENNIKYKEISNG